MTRTTIQTTILRAVLFGAVALTTLMASPAFASGCSATGGTGC